MGFEMATPIHVDGALYIVDFYNQALDEDPEDLKTFERIEKIQYWRNRVL